MRLWIKPDQLAKLGITVTDITNAIQAQNKVNPAGQIGGEPAQKNQQFTYALLAKGRLRSPEQFGNIVVRESPNGGTVRVKDVARVELGQQDYSTISRLNGKPTAVIAIYQLPGSNALQTAEGVRKLMAQMKDRFPEDVDYAISLDQTLPVSEGMREVVETLVIAILLVILVVYLFLQDWRATLIPMLAVPVSLVGTFVLFPLFGFSINTLSMLGLVLAIGLVVDDAIVVVEGVQHHIEEGLAPKDAALKAMKELSGPVVGIALVLASVFVPTAFIPGITGRLYQQFALTIAISVILSAFNALTLSPALAGLLLRPKSEEGTHKHRGPLGKFFDAFNRYWERSTNGFVRWSHAVIRKGALVMVLLVLFGLGAFFFGNRLPSSFMPDEDQGYLYVSMQLPIAASMQRTSEAGRQVENVLANIPGVQYTTSVIGFNLLSFAHTSYTGFFFVTLKPWCDRKRRAEPNSSSMQIRTEYASRVSRSSMSIKPFGHIWAAYASITSMISAAPGRYISRPKPLTERIRKTFRSSMCATTKARTCPFPRSRTSRPITARNSPYATTSIVVRRSSAALPPVIALNRRPRPSKMFSIKPCPTKWASITWVCLIRSRKRGRVCQPGLFSHFQFHSFF